MATEFSFTEGSLVTPTYLTLSSLRRGSGPGVDDTSQRSAYTPVQDTGNGDVDVFAVTLIAGQRYTLDVDEGAGDATGSVDVEIELIDHKGDLVLSDNSGGRDNGSSSTQDPNITVNVNRTGTYFVAVHHQTDEYIDGAFRWDEGSGGEGDYRFVLSTPSLPAPFGLTSGSDRRSFSDARQNVQAGGGSDTLSLNGGDDLAAGGSGNDELFGGAGDDELSGGTGDDRLYGSRDDDVLVGGDGRDRLNGGSGRDSLNAGEGNDYLDGSTGNDTLWGEAGNDVIRGGDGDDFIRGGAGVDRLYGDRGADTFHFLRGESNPSGSFIEDEVRSFSVADVLDLSDLVLGRLTWRGQSSFTGANQVRVVDYRENDGTGYQEVRANLDSDGTAELAFLVDTAGDFRLTSADFIL